jgi:hypothetical protein
VPDWVPRDQNQFADYLSKLKDVDDFGLQPEVFHEIVRRFGQLDVDRFASAHNALLPVFYSEVWSPHSAGANAFTASWSGVRNYCFSPPKVVARVLEHAQECRAEMVLMILDWLGQSWWPLLVRDPGSAWAPFVCRHLRLPGGPGTFRPGRGSADAFFGRRFLQCAAFVLDISFKGEP